MSRSKNLPTQSPAQGRDFIPKEQRGSREKPTRRGLPTPSVHGRNPRHDQGNRVWDRRSHSAKADDQGQQRLGGLGGNQPGQPGQGGLGRNQPGPVWGGRAKYLYRGPPNKVAQPTRKSNPKYARTLRNILECFEIIMNLLEEPRRPKKVDRAQARRII